MVATTGSHHTAATTDSHNTEAATGNPSMATLRRPKAWPSRCPVARTMCKKTNACSLQTASRQPSRNCLPVHRTRAVSQQAAPRTDRAMQVLSVHTLALTIKVVWHLLLSTNDPLSPNCPVMGASRQIRHPEAQIRTGRRANSIGTTRRTMPACRELPQPTVFTTLFSNDGLDIMYKLPLTLVLSPPSFQYPSPGSIFLRLRDCGRTGG